MKITFEMDSNNWKDIELLQAFTAQIVASKANLKLPVIAKTTEPVNVKTTDAIVKTNDAIVKTNDAIVVMDESARSDVPEDSPVSNLPEVGSVEYKAVLESCRAVWAECPMSVLGVVYSILQNCYVVDANDLSVDLLRCKNFKVNFVETLNVRAVKNCIKRVNLIRKQFNVTHNMIEVRDGGECRPTKRVYISKIAAICLVDPIPSYWEAFEEYLREHNLPPISWANLYENVSKRIA